MKLFATVVLITSFSWGITDTASAVVSLPIGTKSLETSGGLTSKKTYRRLSRIHKKIGAEKYEDALKSLKSLEESVGNNKHELAQVYQGMGFVYAQMEDYKNAGVYLKKCLSLKSLPATTALSTMLTLAQIKLATQNYSEAVTDLRNWFAYSKDPAPHAYVLLGTAYAQLKDNKSALAFVKKAIDATAKPQSQWLRFAVALHFELSQFNEAGALLEKLIAADPKNNKYWHQLSGTRLSQNNYAKALATEKLAKHLGFIDDEKRILGLASLYMYRKIPLLSAGILKQGIEKGLVAKNAKHYEFLGNALIEAKELEKAIPELTKAASYSKKGDLYARIGIIHSEMNNWSDAEDSLRKALSFKSLKNRGKVYVSLGIALYNQRKQQEALNSFQMAVAQKSSRRQANDWITYVSDQR